MNKKILVVSILVGTLCTSCGVNKSCDMNAVIEKGLERSVEQSKFLATSLIEEPEQLPRYVLADGTLSLLIHIGGVAAFFSGVLWQLYEKYRRRTIKRICRELYSTYKERTIFS